MKLGIAFLLALFSIQSLAAPDWDLALEGEQRSEENRARDEFRHPRQTLEFFGLEPGMTVLELAPGGGWYTEILAPLLLEEGTYYAAHHGLNAPGGYYRRSLGGFLQKLAADPELYNQVIVTQLQPPEELNLAPAGSVDLALAFRNIHSWLRAGTLDETLAAVHTALKPGGRFGVVQHRARPGTDEATMKQSGYVTRELLVTAAEAAGFELVDSSEINANPRDSADHPGGVWNLPPVLRGDEERRDHYLAIGESDRMTLLFAKPAE